MPPIPVHHTPTVDEPWDGPAAVAAMPAAYATLYACHAWWSAEAESDSGSHDTSPSGDGDPDDEKGSYKFPHHKTKGGPANVNACSNGLARLAAGNVQMPDADVAGVKAHLQAHLDDAKKSSSDNQRRSDVHNLKIARPVARTDPNRKWYRIDNVAAGSTEPANIYIYDEISWFGIMAQDFASDLRAITSPAINLHINSPGGDVFDGIAIMQALKDHPANVTVYVDSLAASIASVIAMAGNEVVMSPSATMMIHDGLSMVIGNAADMRKQADILDKISDTIAGVYAAKSGLDADVWRMAMLEETWYTAQEAVDAGLADRIATDVEPDAKADEKVAAKWDLSIFAHAGRKNAPAPKTPKVRNDAAPDGGDQCPNCKQFNEQGADTCSECGEPMPDLNGSEPEDKATPPQPDEDAGSPNESPSTEEEEDGENPDKKRVPTSASSEGLPGIGFTFDPEIFRTAMADIGKM